jgi:hypothetical protein
VDLENFLTGFAGDLITMADANQTVRRRTSKLLPNIFNTTLLVA